MGAKDSCKPLYLGTPIGHDAFVESYLHNFIADLAAQGDLLAKYAKEEPQIAFLLLHHCFSKKVNHLLRTLPLDVSQAHIIAPFNDVSREWSSPSLTPTDWNLSSGSRLICVSTAEA